MGQSEGLSDDFVNFEAIMNSDLLLVSDSRVGRVSRTWGPLTFRGLQQLGGKLSIWLKKKTGLKIILSQMSLRPLSEVFLSERGSRGLSMGCPATEGILAQE